MTANKSFENVAEFNIWDW